MLWTVGHKYPSSRGMLPPRRVMSCYANKAIQDVHPTDFSLTLFPGQDYNNARVLDFKVCHLGWSFL